MSCMVDTKVLNVTVVLSWSYSLSILCFYSWCKKNFSKIKVALNNQLIINSLNSVLIHSAVIPWMMSKILCTFTFKHKSLLRHYKRDTEDWMLEIIYYIYLHIKKCRFYRLPWTVHLAPHLALLWVHIL